MSLLIKKGIIVTSSDTFKGDIYIEDGIVKEEQVLMGFPHPSGANVNRVAQFEANRDNMIKFIKKHFI